jgi:hypothetical protein
VQADDLTITDMKKAITSTGFSLADESTEAITKLQEELNTYSNPLIMSSDYNKPLCVRHIKRRYCKTPQKDLGLWDKEPLLMLSFSQA